MADGMRRRELEVGAPVLKANTQEKAGREETEGSERRKEKDQGEERQRGEWRASADWGTPKEGQEHSGEAQDVWGVRKGDTRLHKVPEDCRFRLQGTVGRELRTEEAAGEEYRTTWEGESGTWRGDSREGEETP